MNKKRLWLVSGSLVLCLFILSGCSKAASQVKQLNQNNQANLGTRGVNGMPDFGQPDRPADIRGVVKSIIGNEAVVLKMDQPVGSPRASLTSDNANSASTPNAVSLMGSETAGMGAGGGGRAGGFVGGPDGPGGPGGPGGTDATSRAAMLEQLKALSTGEDTITIPVGIQMLKTSVNATTKKRESVEATLADISADKFITIWLNTAVTDKKVADFILIN